MLKARKLKSLLLLASLLCGATASASEEAVPVFTKALPDRLLMAACEGTGDAGGRPILIELRTDGSVQTRSYPAPRCPQALASSWTTTVGSTLLFHHRYTGSGGAPAFSGIWRWDNGEARQLLDFGGRPSAFVKNLPNAVLYGVSNDSTFDLLPAERLDLTTGQARRLVETLPDGRRCTLNLPRLDRPYVPEAGADSPTILSSNCSTERQGVALSFFISAEGQATPRPDLIDCFAFASLGSELWSLCSATEAATLDLVRVTASGIEPVQSFGRDRYLRPTAQDLVAVGGKLVMTLQRTLQRDGVPSGVELHQWSQGSSRLLFENSEYPYLISRSTASGQVWIRSLRSRPDVNGNYQDAALIYVADGEQARLVDDGRFGLSVSPATLGADLPGTRLTFFSAPTGPAEGSSTDRGVEPWVLDRRDFSTYLLADLSRIPGPFASDNGNSRPAQFTAFDGQMYFWAQNTRSNASSVATLFRSAGQAGDPVAVFPSAGQVSTSGGEVQVSSSGGRVSSAVTAATPGGASPQVSYPQGWLQVTVVDLAAGAVSTIQITPTSGNSAKADGGYGLCRREGRCDLLSAAPSVADGDPYDLDGVRNGQLRVLIARTQQKTEGGGSGSSGGSGGSSGEAGGGAMSWWALLPLALFATRRRRPAQP